MFMSDNPCHGLPRHTQLEVREANIDSSMTTYLDNSSKKMFGIGLQWENIFLLKYLVRPVEQLSATSARLSNQQLLVKYSTKTSGNSTANSPNLLTCAIDFQIKLNLQKYLRCIIFNVLAQMIRTQK